MRISFKTLALQNSPSKPCASASPIILSESKFHFGVQNEITKTYEGEKGGALNWMNHAERPGRRVRELSKGHVTNLSGDITRLAYLRLKSANRIGLAHRNCRVQHSGIEKRRIEHMTEQYREKQARAFTPF